jgi:hypothetical protein
MAIGLITYMDAGRREDLLDLISDVSPDENPLSTMLATTTAKGTYHEWMEDYIARPSTVASSVEAKATTYSDLTQPSRRGNFTHIITQSYRVSGTEKAVAVAGMGDPLQYQKAKALKQWKNQQEYNILESTAASGSSGVARQMVGIRAVITSHYTNRNSGTSLTEDMLLDGLQDVWLDVGSDSAVDLVLTSMPLKRRISSFTAGSTKYVDASDKRLVRPVEIYEADTGIVRIMAHKDAYSSNTTPGPVLLGLREDKWRIAYLRKPVAESRPKDGDYESGEIIGELTVEYLAERANFKQTGFVKTGI